MSEMYEMAALSEYPERKYKDRVFRMLFKEKTNALELYNAMNGTAYTNTADMTITTLENALYLGMKNDVSFLLYDQLMLYEHQSTRNPNMPLRDLIYAACVYARLTASKNLYGTKLVKIPEPKFIVFYNGTDKLPERSELMLSEAYEHPSENPALELRTLVLNINQGYNKDLLENCRTLREYMVFVETVRTYEKSMSFAGAMNQSIEECIRKGVLEEFLTANKAEVLKVSIFEYNEEKHLELERREAMEEGEKRLADLLNMLIKDGKTEELQSVVKDEAKRKEYYKKYAI